jgi:hypothetical protein
MSAARAMLGTMSLRVSIHLPLNDASRLMKPVILPPGCGKLATNPLPTGSETTTNTIGIVLVSRCSAATTGVVCPTINRVAERQFFCEGLHAVDIVGGKAVVDLDVAAVSLSQLLKRCPERRETGL